MKVEALLFRMGAAIVVGWMALSLWLFHAGSRSPDPVTGRTYAIREMGTLYVIPLWAHLSSLLCFVGLAAVAIAAGTGLLRALVNKPDSKPTVVAAGMYERRGTNGRSPLTT